MARKNANIYSELQHMPKDEKSAEIAVVIVVLGIRAKQPQRDFYASATDFADQ